MVLNFNYLILELSSSSNSPIISSDVHFATNVHSDGSGFKVPVPGEFDFNQFDYMGIEEEVYYTPIIKPFQDFHSIGLLDQFMVGDGVEVSKKSIRPASNKNNDSVQRQQRTFKKGWEEIKAKVN
jgi:hypothetical protein